MSWLQKLYETYEHCQSMVGVGNSEKDIPLLPICHTTQQAQIEIVIDQEGNFKRASVVPKNEARTIVPCTESSGGRSGKKPINHPLCDKLQYVAYDFSDFGGEVTVGYAGNPKEPYVLYRGALKDWCDSQYSHPKLIAVYKYIEKGQVIKDLINCQVLYLDEKGKLLDKWDNKYGEEIPAIYKVVSANSSPSDAFIRWRVEILHDPQTAVWNDKTLFDSWVKYYSTTKKLNDICFITGLLQPVAVQHPAKLRNDADKAKLISSNDTSGFTFRGRFRNADQACSVGFEITQKAHNALRWLIGRQGYKRDDQAIVAWATNGVEIPDPMADPYALLEMDKLESDVVGNVSTAQELAIKLRNKIAGYAAQLGSTAEIVVMGIESATPGRMSITFYRELTGSELLDRLELWHHTCSWAHDYHFLELPGKKKSEIKRVHVKFVGAPAPSDIADAAFGRRIDEKLRKSTVERILPCIIDGQRIPRDLVESSVQRAANRIGMEEWEWNKTLSIACSLYKKYQKDYKGEDFDMALDENRKTRDYLYGRLLALAESLEQWALKEAGENRQTNSARLMQRFSDHPHTTWRTIELLLMPYKARLGGASAKRQQMISQVISMFEPEDFINDKKLSGEFLLGYHCQRVALWNNEKKLI